jgi:hypothetical protein
LIVIESISDTQQAVKELQSILPAAPIRPPEGSDGEFSTCQHMLVCFLEYRADSNYWMAEGAPGNGVVGDRSLHVGVQDGPGTATRNWKHRFQIPADSQFWRAKQRTLNAVAESIASKRSVGFTTGC